MQAVWLQEKQRRKERCAKEKGKQQVVDSK